MNLALGIGAAWLAAAIALGLLLGPAMRAADKDSDR